MVAGNSRIGWVGALGSAPSGMLERHGSEEAGIGRREGAAQAGDLLRGCRGGRGLSIRGLADLLRARLRLAGDPQAGPGGGAEAGIQAERDRPQPDHPALQDHCRRHGGPALLLLRLDPASGLPGGSGGRLSGAADFRAQQRGNRRLHARRHCLSGRRHHHHLRTAFDQGGPPLPGPRHPGGSDQPPGDRQRFQLGQRRQPLCRTSGSGNAGRGRLPPLGVRRRPSGNLDQPGPGGGLLRPGG